MNLPLRTPALAPPAFGWSTEIAYRLRHLLALKIVGVSAFTWLFFQGYFYTLRHLAYPATVMPLTAVDHWIPFQPHALGLYLSLWFYVGIAPGLLTSVRQLLVYGLWAAALCGSGLLIFHFWPTEVPPRTMDTRDLPGFALLHGVDAAGNACPSLHVATAVYTAAWIERLLRLAAAPRGLRGVNLAWVLAIIWSTVAVRQHVVLDGVAGSALGLLFAALAMRSCPDLGRLRPQERAKL